MRIIPGNGQHIGLRSEQQDAFAFSDISDKGFIAHGGILTVVADGMGGMANGREASQLAVSAMLNAYRAKNLTESIPDALLRALYQANSIVYQLAQSTHGVGNVGTTIVVTVIYDDQLFWLAVGDSHIYLHRKGDLIQLNIDHTYGRELDRQAAESLIDRIEAVSHHDRDSLTSFLGMERIEEIDRNLRPFTLLPGDRVVLCTDGLYRDLLDKEFSQELSKEPQDAADALVAKVLAKRKTVQDNLTITILSVDADTASQNLLESPYGSVLLRNVLILVTVLALMFGLFLAGVYWQQDRENETGMPLKLQENIQPFSTPDVTNGRAGPAETVDGQQNKDKPEQPVPKSPGPHPSVGGEPGAPAEDRGEAKPNMPSTAPEKPKQQQSPKGPEKAPPSTIQAGAGVEIKLKELPVQQKPAAASPTGVSQ